MEGALIEFENIADETYKNTLGLWKIENEDQKKGGKI
jgi:hypothetical protein